MLHCVVYGDVIKGGGVQPQRGTTQLQCAEVDKDVAPSYQTHTPENVDPAHWGAYLASRDVDVISRSVSGTTGKAPGLYACCHGASTLVNAAAPYAA